jgi:hypothetical protein
MRSIASDVIQLRSRTSCSAETILSLVLLRPHGRALHGRHPREDPPLDITSSAPDVHVCPSGVKPTHGLAAPPPKSRTW